MITPLLLLFMVGFLYLFRSYLSIFTFSMFAATALILFKSLKYSAHSPTKEEYIQHSEYMHSILFFESFSSRFGKNSVAIVLSFIFASGLKWINIENYVLLSVMCLSAIWGILSFSLKLKK